MNRPLHLLLVTALAVPAMMATTSAGSDPCAERFCAGAASVDATWHTGSGQGQLGGAGNHVTEDKFDPHHHTTKMAPTDGIQSRTFAKAVVVQGPDGTRAAYVKTDVYLQQDILSRRVADLVSGADPTSPYVVEGLDASRIMLGGTHNHSAPHYTSTAWGVWIFADAFDFRAFDHTARRIAGSIHQAAQTLRPAEVGSAVISYREIQQNILGPSTADDGSPAGMPRDHFDPELAVVRIDDAATKDPIAAIVNFGMHPESIGGRANLISSDFIGVAERVVERSLGKVPGSSGGPVVAWSQGGLGDVEPDQSRANHPDELKEYWRRDFAQAERMSLELSEAVLAAWTAAKDGPKAASDLGFEPVPDKWMEMTGDAAVKMLAYRFPGPVSHPAPTVSNCRTDTPGAPILGFPDCVRGGDPPGWGATVDRLKEAGAPVPENYGVPTYASVQESMTIHLQTLQVGDVLLATCPCEPLTDMTLNLKTRLDADERNQHLGYLPECTERGEEMWCAFPRNAYEEPVWAPVDRGAYERMVAQITHDAAGWEEDPAHLGGEAEPADPQQIKGNFTHDELGTGQGFAIPLMVGTANDYVGYVVSYREYQRGDHYRKALTPFGPRTSDYINTRLVGMARELRGGDSPQDARALAHETFEDLVQAGKVRIFGHGADALSQVYEAAIPDDGGEPGAVTSQPTSLERFAAATLTWQGGSNYTDDPTVTVQRFVPDDGVQRITRVSEIGAVSERGPGGPPLPDAGSTHEVMSERIESVAEGGAHGRWETVATQEGGEVVLSLAYDSWSSDAALNWLAGGHVYEWTATFEAFESTEPGTYRFVVEGQHRSGRRARAYEVVSAPFEVDIWRGLAASDLRMDANTLSFQVQGVEAEVDESQVPGPTDQPPGDVRYPFTYDSAVPFISHSIYERGPWRYCFRCTFRPWAATGTVVEATVTVVRANGHTITRDARLDEATGRWVARGINVRAGDQVSIEPGDLLDEYGNTNSERYVLDT